MTVLLRRTNLLLAPSNTLYRVSNASIVFAAVPEPSSLALCAIAAVIGAGIARRRSQQAA